jgi:hypothetical protein
MATLIPSTFCRYNFSDDREAVASQIFTPLQLQWLQNNLSDIAQQRLTLSFNPAEPEKFMQAEANLKGQIEVIQYLMQCSTAASEQIKIA